MGISESGLANADPPLFFDVMKRFTSQLDSTKEISEYQVYLIGSLLPGTSLTPPLHTTKLIAKIYINQLTRTAPASRRVTSDNRWTGFYFSYAQVQTSKISRRLS
jgi:hypothetical protein